MCTDPPVRFPAEACSRPSQDETRPQLRASVRLFRRDGQALLLVTETGDWSVVSPVGAEVADLCDGRWTAAEIAGRLCQRHGIGLDRATQDVRAYLHQLGEGGFLAGVEAPPVPAAPTDVRGEMAIHLTSRCNLDCLHCYAEAGRCRTEELPVGDVLEALEALRGRASHFVFSGGEPLVYGAWREVIGAAVGLAPVKLITNGTLLTEADAAWLAERRIRIQVSVDGATPEAHDRLRGTGSFEAALRAVRALVAAGHGPSTTLGCVLHHRNVSEVMALVDLAGELGVGGLHFMPVNRHGRAALHWPALSPETGALLEAYRRLSAARLQLRGTLAITGCVGDFVERSLRADAGPRCPVGRNLMIESTGALYPCILLTTPEHRLGRLGETDLGALWSAGALQATARSCHERHATVAECAACDWRALCRGACPGAVLWQRGHLAATDGLCDLRRELYPDVIFALAGAASASGSDTCH